MAAYRWRGPRPRWSGVSSGGFGYAEFVLGHAAGAPVAGALYPVPMSGEGRACDVVSKPLSNEFVAQYCVSFMAAGVAETEDTEMETRC